jgi:lysophospholipase L1-like esterase
MNILSLRYGAFLRLSALLPARLPASATCTRFDFGNGPVAEGFIQVGPDTTYDAKRGYGLEPGPAPVPWTQEGSNALTSDFLCSENSPFLFSVALPEGNYLVKVTLGDPKGTSDTTIKAESRRLMVEHAHTDLGVQRSEVFTVNIRRSSLIPPEMNAPGLSAVQLNNRELGVYHWDDKLTLEFSGPRACVAAVEICPAPTDTTRTVFLVGDSTVTDQTGEPAAGWGQMLPRFFGPGVAIANHAESGETLKSFLTAGRLAKVLEQVRAGDTLFIQFGHNDSKAQWPQTYADAATTYPAYLRAVIAEARLRGVQPVLVTSMHRRKFDAEGHVVNTHGAYPDAVRRVAAEEKVPLIDLHLLSAGLYEKLGVKGSAVAFTDATHHTNYGGYQLARLVVSEIQRQIPALAAGLRNPAPSGPFVPDDPATWSVPASLARQKLPPRGN